MKDRIVLIVLGVFVLLLLGVIIFTPGEKKVEEENFEITTISYVNAEGFAEAAKSDGINILYVMSTSCGYCELFTPIIDGVATKYDLDIKYIDLYDITSQEEYDTFIGSINGFSNEFGGTPTTVIVDGGEIIDLIPGYVDEATLINFFETNNIIE